MSVRYLMRNIIRWFGVSCCSRERWEKKIVSAMVIVTYDDGSTERMTEDEYDRIVMDDLRRSGELAKIYEEKAQELIEACGLHRLKNVTHLPPPPSSS